MRNMKKAVVAMAFSLLAACFVVPSQSVEAKASMNKVETTVSDHERVDLRMNVGKKPVRWNVKNGSLYLLTKPQNYTGLTYRGGELGKKTKYYATVKSGVKNKKYWAGTSKIAVIPDTNPCTVTAKVKGGKVYKCVINVESPYLSVKKLTMSAGDTYNLQLNDTVRKVKWSTSKRKIATVSENGVIKAKKQGTVDIIATVGKSSYVCKLTVKAKRTDEQKYSYTMKADGAAITKYKGFSANIVVPDTLGGKPVVEIGANVFHGKNITSVKLPATIKRIGESAFAKCKRMSSINLPIGLEEIGFSAFTGCTGLTSLVLPDSVTKIDKLAFSGCINLTSFNIPKGVTVLEAKTFHGCRGLQNVVIPEGVTMMWEDVFAGCTGLTEVVLPNTLGVIRNRAFYGCKNLTSVTVPASVKYMSDDVFQFCDNVTICGEADSYAAKYAAENNITFVVK